MRLSQYSAVSILITIYVRVLSCNQLFDVNMVRDFKDHLQVNWIIMQTCKKTDYTVVNLAKDIEKSMVVYTNILEWNDFLSAANFARGGNFKPLVLLTCRSCPLDCLTPINDMPVTISRFSWLFLRRENTSIQLNGINIPISSFFMVIDEARPDLYIINEVYRISTVTDLIYSQYGTWSSQNGLNSTLTPWEERRSNFYGQNVTTLVDPENSANPLANINRYFTPCYMAMARRLNFTIETRNNPQESHEVSIVLDWADSPSEKIPFLPICHSRQSIYFKDIGVGIQLDGYITPFQMTVWQALIFLVVLSGILSYIATNVYTRLTHNKKLPKRIDFHIFKNFYILCQKSETDEKYAAHRLITLSQWIISIFLLSCYSAIFISFISVEIPKPPFTTIDELLTKKDYNIVTSKYISPNTLLVLKTSGDPKLRELYETHFDPEKNSVADAPEFFCNNKKYIFVTSELHVNRMKRTPHLASCKISKKHIRLYYRFLTWFIERDSHHRRVLQAFMIKMYSAGLMQNRFVQQVTFKGKLESSDFKDITLEDTTMLFIIIIVGLLLSLLIFFFEIGYKKILSSK